MGKRIGFIGAGRMGSALIRGIVSSGFAMPEDIYVHDIVKDAVEALSSKLGINAVESITEIAESVDVIIIAVKPQIVDEVLTKIADRISSDILIVSIAAGITTFGIESRVGKASVVRVMPNAPALVGDGITAISGGSSASRDDVDYACGLFSAVGKTLVVSEDLIDQVTAVSGSGPAYFYLLTEALTSAAVTIGLTEEHARLLAEQTFIGSAALLKDGRNSPRELRALVTSPKGTTEAAVSMLEKEGFEKIVSNAVQAALQRARELGRQEGS